MRAVISPDVIQLPPGAVIRLPASWHEYQQLCEQRGDGSLPRIKYRSGNVWLMSPLPKHGRDASLIADVIKTLLDCVDRDYDAFTPVTMTIPEESGIEPDYCFYIDHWHAVSGKERIDWQTDPPPDLVLEVDVTSYSDVNDYVPYKVPEVWLFRSPLLEIHQFQGGDYQLQRQSRYFPGVNLAAIVSRALHITYERNTSTAIRDLKQRLKPEG